MIKRLSKCLQKLRSIDIAYVRKNGSWLVFGQAITAIFTIVTAVFLANVLTPEVYGNYKYALSIGILIGAFSLTGMGTALTQSIARGFDESYPLALRYTFTWNLLPSAIALSIAAYYFINGNTLLTYALLIVAVFLPITQTGLLAHNFLNGKKEFRKLTLFGVGKNAITSIAVITAAYFIQEPLPLILASLGVSALITAAITVYTLVVYKRTNKAEKDVIRFGKHLSVMNFFMHIAHNIDNVIMFTFFGSAQLAVYAFAASIPIQVAGILRNIRPLLIPRFSEYKKVGEIKKRLWEKMILAFGISSIVVLLYILVAPFIYTLLFPQYEESIFYSQLYALYMIPATMALIPSVFLETQKMTRALYIQRFSVPIIRIGMYIVLGYFFGIVGIIVTLILAKILSLSVLSYFVYTHNSEKSATSTGSPNAVS